MAESGNIFDDATTARLLAMLVEYEGEHRLRGVGQPICERLYTGGTWRWGVLDGELVAGGTATVSLWISPTGDWDNPTMDSMQDWEDCYAPFVLKAGSVAAGKRVAVCDFGTRKIVMLHEC